MYKKQKLLYIFPLIQHTIVVCISNISPMAVGCFICVNINLVIVLIAINSFVIIGGILLKMLVLGINEIGKLTAISLKENTLQKLWNLASVDHL
jgi:hypothetical protein